MNLDDFVREYFVNPMQYPDKYPPYNIFNTLVYAALALLAVYLVFKGLKRLGVEIDERFFFAIVPFVVFGSAVRVIVDAGILPRSIDFFGQTIYPFITPGIYFVVFFTVIASMLASFWLAKKTDKGAAWWLGSIGVVLAVASFAVVAPLLKFFVHGLLIVLLGLAAVGLVEVLERMRFGRFSVLERFTVFSQAFDGAATFVGVGVGTPAVRYWEQHVAGNFIIDFFGNPFAFYVVKVLFVLAVVFLLKRELSERKKGEAEERSYILLLVTIFGLAPGTRDALRIMAGV